MQSDKHVFDDIAKMFNGLAGTVAGMGREAQAAFKERNREWVAGLDLVGREEFDAVKELAAKARAEADALAKRVAVLEVALGAKASAKAPASAAPKAAAKPASKPAAKAAPRKPAAKG